jgi:hypothetical protein
MTFCLKSMHGVHQSGICSHLITASWRTLIRSPMLKILEMQSSHRGCRHRRRFRFLPWLRHPRLRSGRRRLHHLRRHTGTSCLGNRCGKGRCHPQGSPRWRPLGTSCRRRGRQRRSRASRHEGPDAVIRFRRTSLVWATGNHAVQARPSSPLTQG